jgi:hypothetical protein
MTDDVTQATLATWAARNLPARLDVAATAKLLGFAESDIQVLMAVGKLTPLGEDAPFLVDAFVRGVQRGSVQHPDKDRYSKTFHCGKNKSAD